MPPYYILNHYYWFHTSNRIVQLFQFVEKTCNSTDCFQAACEVAYHEFSFAHKLSSQTIQIILKDFIWRGKKFKTKQSTLIEEYADWGLCDLDLPSSLTSDKIYRIQRLFDNSFHPWKTLAKRLLHKVVVYFFIWTRSSLNSRYMM